MDKKEYKIGKDPGIEWWKKRKHYEGHISEITFVEDENYVPTPENFQVAKNWQDIRLHFGAITKEEYDEKIKELKKEHGIED